MAPANQVLWLADIDSQSLTTRSISNCISPLCLEVLHQIHLKPQSTVSQRQKSPSECIDPFLNLRLTPIPSHLTHTFQQMINTAFHQNLQLRKFHQLGKHKLKLFWETSRKGHMTIFLFWCHKLKQFLRVIDWWFRILQLHIFCCLFQDKQITNP